MNVHQLHQTFQEWARALPLPLQQRMSCELLGTLAQCLIRDSTTLEIVNSLIDIHHLIEKNLHSKRQQLVKNHKSARRQRYKLEPRGQRMSETNKLRKVQDEELKKFDVQILETLSAKVEEQQSVLMQAGVPGFKVTKDSIEIQVQMCLIDFIIRSADIIYFPKK